MNGGKIAAGGTAGGGLGAAIVYLLGRFDVNLNPEDGALIAMALVAVCAFIAHNGIVGALRLIWHGSGPAPSSEQGLTLVEALIVLIVIVIVLLLLGVRAH